MNYVFLVERSSQILWLSLIFDLNLVWGIIPGWGSGMQLGASLSPWILVLVIRNTCHVGVTDALLRLTIIQFIYLVMNGYHGMASEQSVYFVLDTRTSPIHRIKLGSSWMGFEFRPSRKWRTFLYNNRYTKYWETWELWTLWCTASACQWEYWQRNYWQQWLRIAHRRRSYTGRVSLVSMSTMCHRYFQ